MVDSVVVAAFEHDGLVDRADFDVVRDLVDVLHGHLAFSIGKGNDSNGAPFILNLAGVDILDLDAVAPLFPRLFLKRVVVKEQVVTIEAVRNDLITLHFAFYGIVEVASGIVLEFFETIQILRIVLEGNRTIDADEAITGPVFRLSSRIRVDGHLRFAFAIEALELINTGTGEATVWPDDRGGSTGIYGSGARCFSEGRELFR